MHNYICPVCGWGDLPRYPSHYDICPCCGTEFDLDDFRDTHQVLLDKWKQHGCKWFSIYRPAPDGWDAANQIAQLKTIDVMAHNLKSAENEAINQDIVRIWWSEKDKSYIAIVRDRPSISGLGEYPKDALEELTIAQSAVISVLEEDQKKLISFEVRKGIKHSTDQLLPTKASFLDRARLRQLQLESASHLHIDTCPFCGSRAKLILVNDTWSVECEDIKRCGAWGPLKPTPDTAAVGWNNRSFPRGIYASPNTGE